MKFNIECNKCNYKGISFDDIIFVRRTAPENDNIIEDMLLKIKCPCCDNYDNYKIKK